MFDNGDGPDDCLDLTQARLRRTGDMINAEIRALYDYWEALRAGRPVPYRAEVDPRDMRCHARNLFILEDLGGADHRFRLAGTALVEAFGMELRGMSARSLMEGRARESFSALIAETLAEPGVGYARLTATVGAGAPWEVLLLPMRSDFGAIDRMLGGLIPVSARPERPGDARLRFRIDDMTIRPVKIAESALPAPGPVAGFAEGQAPFAGPSAGEGRLRAIEGGRAAADGPSTRRPRGHLRVVRDE
jgi:hypothetical protein